MFVINAPYLAVQTWGMVKRWLDPRTQSKIEILGPGPGMYHHCIDIPSHIPF